jgi:DNA-binding transcriptional ArsR family regulator
MPSKTARKPAKRAQHTADLDRRLVKALSHPLRMQLLSLLVVKVASPVELATQLGEPIGNVSYHIRMLADLELIELVSTTPRRGAIEHHYRAVERPFLTDEQWARIPQGTRKGVSASVIEHIVSDLRAAIVDDTLDARADRHLSRLPLVLDEEGWKDLMSVLSDTLDRAFEIQAASASRLVDSDEEGFAAQVAMAGFEPSPRPARAPKVRRGAKSRRT